MKFRYHIDRTIDIDDNDFEEYLKVLNKKGITFKDEKFFKMILSLDDFSGEFFNEDDLLVHYAKELSVEDNDDYVTCDNDKRLRKLLLKNYLLFNRNDI